MKTAEEILTEAYLIIKSNQSSESSDVDPFLLAAMDEYAEQFKPKWIMVDTDKLVNLN